MPSSVKTLAISSQIAVRISLVISSITSSPSL